jgi:hypothetical protein
VSPHPARRATFSHQEGREKAYRAIAFSRFFRREKVPDRADEGPRAASHPVTIREPTPTKTDRRQLDRLLDSENMSVTRSTLRRAASVLGRTLCVEIG